MVSTVEECKALVAACLYPPRGRRGSGPRRASNYYRDAAEYMALANDAIFVMPQVENIATIDVIDEFLAVPGLDAVAIGPNDMSGTAGVFGDRHHPKIANAIEATPARGVVGVEIAAHADRIDIAVRDAGAGMPPDVLARVGTPFFTTRERGTGLGVVLARAAFEQHGGKLEYRSAPGQGTTVLGTLPRAPASAPSASAHP